ncbi:MAG TPA: hypothetical protein VLA59_00045 [Patescibacteria group bacterium]|nr:hypothetical protein [Patescibacteria group bacterium]
MPSKVPPIARIRLARSPARLFALPALLVLVAAGLVVLAVPGPLRMGEVAWYAALAVAALLALVAMAVAVRLMSIRLDVEEESVHLHWLGGGRRYALAPGPVTRVRLRGENASRLRARTRWLGWGLGRARLRDEEDVEVVRLAGTPTVILVPTERGRLAIAASSEDELIDALSRAARARQRLEELAAAAPVATPAEAGPSPEPEPAPEPEPEPHVLTGIERALLEERLAREREEAEAAAAALPVTQEPLPESPAMPAGADAGAPPVQRAPWRIGRRGVPRVARPRPSSAFVLVPLIGAGIVWGAATALDRLPDPTSDLGRLTSLALVLAGPATSVGAIMARAWWPRLVGVVVTAGLAASVFIGRALLGA